MAATYRLGQTLKGVQGTYTLLKEIHKTVWLASDSHGETAVIKGVCHSRIKNESDVLRKFQSRAPIRPLIDNIMDPTEPPGIALQYLEDDLLAASSTRPLNRSEIKQVARIVLDTLAVLHEDGYVHTDIKPNNILCSYKRGWRSDKGNLNSRFSEVLVADFGSCVPSSSNHARQGDLIGAPMFRSPEAILRLPWTESTDIWSFGAMLMSLFFSNYHIFNPRVPISDPKYDRMVLQRMHMFFGPFPLTYKTMADTETLEYLTDIMTSVPERKPFHLIKDKEFEPEDKTFLVKIMRLDPRDRPTAKQLLEDTWFS